MYMIAKKYVFKTNTKDSVFFIFGMVNAAVREIFSFACQDAKEIAEIREYNNELFALTK